MILSILQSNLDTALSMAVRIAGRTGLPITQSVLLRAADGRLHVTATNLEMSITATVAAKVEQDGTALVDAATLHRLISGLPNDRVDVTATARGIEIKCARSRLRLSVGDPEDFPPTPTLVGEPVALLDPEALRGAIRRVAFAALGDGTRPVLGGVHVEGGGAELHLAAGDGHRLNWLTLTLSEPMAERVSAIVPAKTMGELARLLDKEDKPVAITVDRNKGCIRFALTNTTLTSQLIAGTFPNFRQVLPVSRRSRLVVDTADLAQAVRTSAVFSRSETNAKVRMVAPTEIDLWVSGTSETTGDGQVMVDCVTEGEPAARMAMNGSQVIDALGAIGNGKVALDWSGEGVPVVLRSYADGVALEDFVQVLMPLADTVGLAQAAAVAVAV